MPYLYQFGKIPIAKEKKRSLISYTTARVHGYWRDFCSHSKPCSKKFHAKLFDLADYPMEECCATTNPSFMVAPTEMEVLKKNVN
jgi:hypothetical protein